jgi:hypothetical protein
MKKILCILLISVYCFSVSAQQKDFKIELYIGAKGGMTLSQVRFYPNVQTSFMDGYTGGLIFRMISEPHIGFQVELNYTQRGWKENPFTGQYVSTSYFHQLNYLDIPIMTHVNLGKKAVRFILNLGPEISFLTSENQGFIPPEGITSDIQGYQPYYGQKIDTSADISFTGGIGMEYHIKGGSIISLEGRVFYSLPNILDTNKYTYKASQNNGVQATIAYLFQLNKRKL